LSIVHNTAPAGVNNGGMADVPLPDDTLTHAELLDLLRHAPEGHLSDLLCGAHLRRDGVELGAIEAVQSVDSWPYVRLLCRKPDGTHGRFALLADQEIHFSTDRDQATFQQACAAEAAHRDERDAARKAAERAAEDRRRAEEDAAWLDQLDADDRRALYFDRERGICVREMRFYDRRHERVFAVYPVRQTYRRVSLDFFRDTALGFEALRERVPAAQIRDAWELHLASAEDLLAKIAAREGLRVYRNHCYSCKRPLSSLTETECGDCRWLVCSCGACGCGYAGHSEAAI
jgi:hypothetical protein